MALISFARVDVPGLVLVDVPQRWRRRMASFDEWPCTSVCALIERRLQWPGG
jgi:hypothetical protein